MKYVVHSSAFIDDGDTTLCIVDIPSDEVPGRKALVSRKVNAGVHGAEYLRRGIVLAEQRRADGVTVDYTLREPNTKEVEIIDNLAKAYN